MAIKIFKSSDQGAPQSAAVGWRVASALPPFQMFAAERMRNANGYWSGESPVGGLNHA